MNKKGMYALAFESEEVTFLKSGISYKDARRELIDIANFYFQPMKKAFASIKSKDENGYYSLHDIEISFKRKRIIFKELDR